MKTPAELIADYLQESKTTKVAFCGNCRIHRSSLHKYLKGLPLHPLVARKIQYATGSKIKAEDLLRKI